jgi:hypothetical protein
MVDKRAEFSMDIVERHRYEEISIRWSQLSFQISLVGGRAGKLLHFLTAEWSTTLDEITTSSKQGL